MPEQLNERHTFTGFGRASLPNSQEDVFILAIYRDGSLTASAYATERGAMEAATDLLDEERDEDEARSLLADRFAHVQHIITDEGGSMEIIPSPIS